MQRGINTEEYNRFCKFLEKSCGITLGENKDYLVRSRLNRILEESPAESLGELIDLLEKRTSPGLQLQVIDAMTTNETLWFRDGHPFDVLRETVLDELRGPRTGPLRIWSAACSTGQEPYSISMSISEYLDTRPGALPAGVEITATDISPSVIKQAREALYDDLEVSRGLSPERRQRFFSEVDARLQVKRDICHRVKFRELNLLQRYATLGRFDIVFCRNVLIYFSHENKVSILSRIAGQLKPGGYLFMGGSEPLASYSGDFEMIRCRKGVVYQLGKGKP